MIVAQVVGKAEVMEIHAPHVHVGRRNARMRLLHQRNGLGNLLPAERDKATER